MAAGKSRDRVLSFFLSLLTLFVSSAALFPGTELPSAPLSSRAAKAPATCACHHCPGVDQCCCEHGQAARGSTCDRSPEEGRTAQTPVLSAGPVLMICLLPLRPEGSPSGRRRDEPQGTSRRFPPDVEQIDKVPIPLA